MVGSTSPRLQPSRRRSSARFVAIRSSPKNSRSESPLLRADDEDALGQSVARMKEMLAESATRVLDLFRSWDLNGDGIIKLSEFIETLPQLGFRECTPEDAKRLFHEFDRDQTGEISYKEVCAHGLLHTRTRAHTYMT